MYPKLTLMADKKIITKKSLDFFEKYLNNAAPTGYEWEGQKIWMDYLKPYVDTFITDTYGTAVGVINPEAKYKVVILEKELSKVFLAGRLFIPVKVKKRS